MNINEKLILTADVVAVAFGVASLLTLAGSNISIYVPITLSALMWTTILITALVSVWRS
jgi:hypothetical protein